MSIYKWLEKVIFYKKYNISIYSECFIFLEYILNKNRIWIELNKDFILSNKHIEYLNIFLIERLRGVPISYILRECYFYNIKLYIYNDIFIPRKKTELMLEYIIFLIKNNNLKNILDLGSGTGAISLSIAKNCIYTNVIGIDNNVLAINLCKYNKYRLKLFNVIYKKSNWFSYLRNKLNKFDLIVSNPPYICSSDICLKKGDLRFENYNSLVSFNKGLKDLIYIIKISFFYLENNGWLVLEHSLFKKDIIKKYFIKYYFNVVSFKYINYIFTVGQKLI